MEHYYFPQQCPYCCSAQALAVMYNSIHELDGPESMNEFKLFQMFPDWQGKLSQPIGTSVLQGYVDQLFNVKSIIRRNTKKLQQDIQNDCFILLYIDNLRDPQYGHYTPVLEYYPERNSVLIGESVSHRLREISIDELTPRIKCYLIFK